MNCANRVSHRRRASGTGAARRVKNPGRPRPVSRFRSLQALAAISERTSESKGHEQHYDSSAAFEPDVRNNVRREPVRTSGSRHRRRIRLIHRGIRASHSRGAVPLLLPRGTLRVGRNCGLRSPVPPGGPPHARRKPANAALGRSGVSKSHLPREYGALHVPAKACPPGLDPGSAAASHNGMRQHNRPATAAIRRRS